MTAKRAKRRGLTPARRRALEAIRDGYGRCGLANTSGFTIPPADPAMRSVMRFVREQGWAERGPKLSSYSYRLDLTDLGRDVLDA